MPNRRKETLEVRTLLNHIRIENSDRRISFDVGVHRTTVRKYRRWAQQQGLLTGTLPDSSTLKRQLDATLPVLAAPQTTSTVEPFRDLVIELRTQGVEVKAIYHRLSERGFAGTYSSVYRFVRSLEPRDPQVTVRVETKPGYEAQVDFGDVGQLVDEKTGEMRRAYAFVMVLSYSRHLYVEFVFDQTVRTWVGLHMRAFAEFGGVPSRVVLDNLKAGITKACWDVPVVNRTYADFAESYGFLLAPCRPATPEHKGKVESGVHFVQRNFFGGREPGTRAQANRDVLAWRHTTAGMRIHGTTRKKPLVQFDRYERQTLGALPLLAYDVPAYKKVKLHRDCYVVFDGSFYSAPFRLVGQMLWVRAGLNTVVIFNDSHEAVATHDRANEPGARHTHLDHLPQEKVPGLTRSRAGLTEHAQRIGWATQEIVEHLLGDQVLDRSATAGRLLGLAGKYSEHRLEAACARALQFQDGQYDTIKRILAAGLDEQVAAPVPQAPMATTYARTSMEIFGSAAGGASWM